MGVVEKGRPHYLLTELKTAFADAARLNRSFTSRQGADNLKMDDETVVAVIQGLTQADFEKSMTSHADHRIWQDVYKPRTQGTTLYLKFTLDAMNNLFLISFKEA
jgi:motility quorum-sensing regulator/GCU-specific mRNA interferase toxin